jgi:hypothetical protein
MKIRLETVAVKTLAGLVKSLIGAKQPREVQERAQKELLRANPGLGKEDGVKPGIAIVVPDLGAPLAAAEGSASPATTPGQAAADVAFAAVGSRLGASLAAAQEEAQTLRLKRTQDALLAAHSELTRERLDAIASQAEAEASQTAAVVMQFRQGLEDAAKHMPRR